MRLAVIGPQNTGKSTFIRDFLKTFPHYKSPQETYRDVVEKDSLEINQRTSEGSQMAIRNFLFEQAKSFKGRNVIFDRCLLDNYIYSLAQHQKGKIKKSFIVETKRMMHASLKNFDCLILIPTAVGVELVVDKLRDTDKLYIDHINKLFIETIIEFSRTNSTPIWVISGNRKSRIETIREKLKRGQ